MGLHTSELKRVQVQHLKQRGEEALRARDYRQARELYTQALAQCTTGSSQDKPVAKLLLSNRSLVELLAGRPQAALEDAEAAVQLAPGWAKAHWRRGKAAAALKQWPVAVQAYLTAWQLSTDSQDKQACRQQLQGAICRLTRQQLAVGILALCGLKADTQPDQQESCVGGAGCAEAAQHAGHLPTDSDGCACSLQVLGDKPGIQICSSATQVVAGPCTLGSPSSTHSGCSSITTTANPLEDAASATSPPPPPAAATSIVARRLGSSLQQCPADHELMVEVEGVVAPAAWWQQQQLYEAMYQLVKGGEAIKDFGGAGAVGRYQADYQRWLLAGAAPQEELLLLQALLGVKLKDWQGALTAATGALDLLQHMVHPNQDLLCGLLLETLQALADAAGAAAAANTPSSGSCVNLMGSVGSAFRLIGSPVLAFQVLYQVAVCGLMTALDLLPMDGACSTDKAASRGASIGKLQDNWSLLLNTPRYTQQLRHQLQHKLETAQQQLTEQQQIQVYTLLAAGQDWLKLLLPAHLPTETLSSNSNSTAQQHPNSATAARGSTAVDGSTQGLAGAGALRLLGLSAASAEQQLLLRVTLTWGAAAGLQVLTGQQREAARKLLAAAAGVPVSAVQLEGAYCLPGGTLRLHCTLAFPDGQGSLLAAFMEKCNGGDATVVLCKPLQHQQAAEPALTLSSVGTLLTGSVAELCLEYCSVAAVQIAAAASTAARAAATATGTATSSTPTTSSSTTITSSTAKVTSPAPVQQQQQQVCSSGQHGLDAAPPQTSPAVSSQALGQSLSPEGVSFEPATVQGQHLAIDANTMCSTQQVQLQELPQQQEQHTQQGKTMQLVDKQQQHQQQVLRQHQQRSIAKGTAPDTRTNTTAQSKQLQQQQLGLSTAANSTPLPGTLALPLPYAHYQLVTAEGCPVERPNKHPFCFSRVMYSHQECRMQEEVWVQLEGMSCRWRQSASEVRIICTAVPPGLSSKLLAVDIEPYHLLVRHRVTGEVFLEGDLERGVVPQDCCWMLEWQQQSRVLVLLLAKMNLELYDTPWQHSASWWPRLFRDDPVAAAWDDYDKDYSDLPAAIAATHAAATARQEAQQQQEAQEKQRRQSVQGVIDRSRRERLHRLTMLKQAFWSRAACSTAPSGP